MTILLIVQYLPLVVLPALLFHSPARGLIVWLTGSALVSALLVEVALYRLGNFRLPVRSFRPKGVVLITILGLLATELAALSGAGAYSTQIGSASTSTLASVFTPLRPWVTIGATLILYAWSQGQYSTRAGILLVSLPVAVTVVVSVQTGFLNPILSLGFALGFAGLLTRALRVRHLVMALLVLFLVLPTLYQVRNERRVQQGGSEASIFHTKATDRLRVDKSVAGLKLVVVPLHLGQPGIIDLLRLGLIPRFLDPGRAQTDTGSLLSQALGQSRLSTTSFTVLGNVYAFSDSTGLYVYSALLALGLGLCVRIKGPWGLVASVLLVQSCIALTSGYPESVAGFLQSLVSMLAAYAFLKAFASRRASRQRLGHSPSRPVADPGRPTALAKSSPAI